MNDPSSFAVAVDGGGTRCRVACVQGNQVVSVETGPANVSSDFEAGIRAVLDGVAALGVKVEAELTQSPAFVGLAGVTGPDVASRVRAALPFPRMQVEEDRLAALYGALGDADGALVHCGTGSFFGLQHARKARFVGGWGAVLGDEASACWIGRQALTASLDGVDGLRSTSDLTAAILARFGGATGIVQFAGNADAAAFGALARDVTEAAILGDAVAVALMRAGAEHIAFALQSLGWSPGVAICLTGGIGPSYQPYLPDEMRAWVTEPRGTPLDGAVALAQEFARNG